MKESLLMSYYFFHLLWILGYNYLSLTGIINIPFLNYHCDHLCLNLKRYMKECLPNKDSHIDWNVRICLKQQSCVSKKKFWYISTWNNSNLLNSKFLISVQGSCWYLKLLHSLRFVHLFNHFLHEQYHKFSQFHV